MVVTLGLFGLTLKCPVDHDFGLYGLRLTSAALHLPLTPLDRSELIEPSHRKDCPIRSIPKMPITVRPECSNPNHSKTASETGDLLPASFQKHGAPQSVEQLDGAQPSHFNPPLIRPCHAGPTGAGDCDCASARDCASVLRDPPYSGAVEPESEGEGNTCKVV